ncbi:hypothetical protein Tco_0170313 [Tanacetum coccineum]
MLADLTCSTRLNFHTNIEEHDFMADRLEVFDSDCEDELNPTLLFMVDRVDAFDSDSDEEATSGTIFIVKLSPIELVSEHNGSPSYGTDSLSEVPTYDNYDMLNPFGHVTQHSEQSVSINVTSVAETSDNNVTLITPHRELTETTLVKMVPLMI